MTATITIDADDTRRLLELIDHPELTAAQNQDLERIVVQRLPAALSGFPTHAHQAIASFVVAQVVAEIAGLKSVLDRESFGVELTAWGATAAKNAICAGNYPDVTAPQYEAIKNSVAQLIAALLKRDRVIRSEAIPAVCDRAAVAVLVTLGEPQPLNWMN